MENFNLDNNKKEKSPSYLKMYEISDLPEIMKCSFLKNEKNEIRDLEIKEQAEKDLSTTEKVKGKVRKENKEMKIIKEHSSFLEEIDSTKSDEEAFSLLEKGLESENPKIQADSLRKFWFIPEDKRYEFFLRGIEKKDINVRLLAISLIYSQFSERREEFEEKILNEVKNGLKSEDKKEKLISAAMIDFVPENEQKNLRKELLKKIKVDLFEEGSEEEKYLEIVQFLENKDRFSVIKLGLDSEDTETKKKALNLFRFLPEEDKEEAFRLISEKGFDKEFVQSRLYEFSNLDDQKFSRQDFDKDGSETFLLGGKLKNKFIFKNMRAEHFLAWQRAYENHTKWKELGFDYVPIEPIMSYSLNKKEGLVGVYAGVLDLSLSDWFFKTTYVYNEELKEQKNKIIEGLKKIKIIHGDPLSHTVENNFCLRFFRDELGKIDFKRVPRLYLIDFDEAICI